MSKSITEKELAEKLREECDINRHNGWNHAARKIAEAMGVNLAPEKPEPGTWHVVDEGPRKGYAAVVQQNGVLVMFNEYGDSYRREPDEDWPALTPARVVPAGPVELSEEEVGELWSDWIGDLAELNGGYHPEASAHLTATVNAALAKHGHGRVEVSADQVYGCIREVWDSDAAISPAVLTDEIMELLEGSK